MKKFLRNVLRSIIPMLPYRGRHRLSDVVGKMLAPRPSEEVVEIGNFAIQIDHDLSTCRRMFYGVYEMPFVNFLRSILKEGDVFLDLGANIGYITAVVHKLVGPQGKVVSCGPSPTCTNGVKKNNPNMPMDVFWVQAAVMDRDGTFSFCDTPHT